MIVPNLEQRLRRVLSLLLAVLGLALVTACASSNDTPATTAAPAASREGQPVLADAQRAAALRRYGGPYTEGSVAGYVERVGQQLVAANGLGTGTWRFTVLSSPQVNAFATEQGDVFVTRGLLAVLQDEAELAAVMGHEMGHVLARHAAQRRAQEARIYQTAIEVARSTRDPQLALAFAEMELVQARAYSRDQEFEADRLAIQLLTKAGFDSTAAARSLQRLLDYNLLQARVLGLPPDVFDRQSRFATHPRTVDRVEAARIAAGGGNVSGRRDSEAYLDALNGMLYGDPPQEGFARGRHFLHPQLGFAFEAPVGYTLLNSPQSVQARGPDNAYMVFGCTARRPDGNMIDSMRRLFPSVPLSDARTLVINGFEAATGITPRSSTSGDVDGRVVAINFPPGLCTFLLVSRAVGSAARAEALFHAARTFRRLSASEVAQARPRRLVVVTVKPGDTPERLAARSPADDGYRLARFLVLNGLQPGDQLSPGQRVRIVVSE
ncbi:M48 family metalloprotease [Vineibacter terrae]|uniref:M48 family metalloprotease n=1 Tax=Vineibacter terrae TaxID=2586908 RepID=UPI002E373188|nr:M48 family metalloprotease [Vineibacter terrae]HEX2892008.1 M48 family metalloprotease [Vineibacter terrae]